MSTGTMKSCGACRQDMERSAFSKKQWERKKFRRCKACVENENPFQRPSKKDHRPEKKKENIPVVVAPPAARTKAPAAASCECCSHKDQKPQNTPERPPCNLTVLDETQPNVGKEVHVANLEAKPAQIPVNNHAETKLQEVAKQMPPTIVNTATVMGSSNDIAEQPSKIKEIEPLDRDVLSESTKSNSGNMSAEVPLVETSTVPTASAATVGDENIVENATSKAKAEKEMDATPPTPNYQQASDPNQLAPDMSNAHFSSTGYLSRNNPTSSFESKTPSRVEEMVQEHDAIFRSVIGPSEGQQESEEYDDPQELHRVSTEDVMDFEVQPIVNVEQEIYELLNPSSSDQGILFVENSEAFKDQDDDDSPSSTSSKRQSTPEASTLVSKLTIAMNNKGQASDTNIAETTTQTEPTPTDIDVTTRESIESDALDWDPTAMANLSPTPSMPSSPPPVPPIETNDDDEGNEDDEEDASSDSNAFDRKALIICFSCFGSVLCLMLGKILFPQNSLPLVFGIVVGSAGIMLVSQLYAEGRGSSRSANDSQGDAMAVDSLLEPLLSGAEDRVIISDEV